MKKFLFVFTHLGSGWESLTSSLKSSSHIDFFDTFYSYDHYDDLVRLSRQIHKNDNVKAIWGDVILHNKDFTFRSICQKYPFIFWSAPFAEAVPEIMKLGYGRDEAVAYYGFRLEGMKQYYRRCRRALWNPALDKQAEFASIL